MADDAKHAQTVAVAAATIVTIPTSTTKLKATLRRPTPIVLSRPSSPIRLDTSDENRPANARAAKSMIAARNARVIDSNTTSWDVAPAIRSEVHTAAAPGTCSIMAAATAEGCAPSFTFTITHEMASKGSTLSQTLSRYGLSAAMVRAAFTSKMRIRDRPRGAAREHLFVPRRRVPPPQRFRPHHRENGRGRRPHPAHLDREPRRESAVRGLSLIHI